MTATEGMKIYKDGFKKIFPGIAEKDYEEMKVGNPMEWDSLHHIQLISELERSFSIRFNGDDVPKLRSFREGIGILRDKYGIPLGNS